jgi:hypothetical protein
VLSLPQALKGSAFGYSEHSQVLATRVFGSVLIHRLFYSLAPKQANKQQTNKQPIVSHVLDLLD